MRRPPNFNGPGGSRRSLSAEVASPDGADHRCAGPPYGRSVPIMTPFELPTANTSGRIVRRACALKRHEGSGRVTREISRPNPRGNALDRRPNFHPLRDLVDSTRRNSLISWQKRAAVLEHGFESRWRIEPVFIQRQRASGKWQATRWPSLSSRRGGSLAGSVHSAGRPAAS